MNALTPTTLSYCKHPLPALKNELKIAFNSVQYSASTLSVKKDGKLTIDMGLPLRTLLQSDSTIDSLLSISPIVTFLLDLKSNTYWYMSSNAEKILGYSRVELQKKEITTNSLMIYKEDAHAIRSLTQILYKNIQKDFPLDLSNYTLNREFRIQKKDGSHLQVLEQSKVYERGGRGEILSLYGQLNNITNLKKKQGTAVYITCLGKEERVFFATKQEASPLSERELEVMFLLSKGLSSKQIAYKLSISFHTVTKHRQKMLIKTHSKNSSELIHFADYNELV